MPDFLTGREVSGTPLETRDVTRGAAGQVSAELRSFGEFLSSILVDPRSSVSALQRTMEPFRRRETAEQVAGLRSGLGRAGARFGRSADDAEIELRGRLAEGFAREDSQAVNDQMNILLQALAALRGQSLQFVAPGAPNFQEGILGDALGAIGNVIGARIAGGRGEPGTTGTTGATPVNTGRVPNDPFGRGLA